ncbi:MAG: hypothetical protein IMX00_08760 [Limnochordales bacterium]|nr:hypothetical protein [Limnochordales bacterium]
MLNGQDRQGSSGGAGAHGAATGVSAQSRGAEPGVGEWEAIVREAERLAPRLMPADKTWDVVGEAKRIPDVLKSFGYDEDKLAKYLHIMATNAPPRSKKTEKQYQEIERIWRSWAGTCPLTPQAKAKAWAWAVRIATYTNVFGRGSQVR